MRTRLTAMMSPVLVPFVLACGGAARDQAVASPHAAAVDAPAEAAAEASPEYPGYPASAADAPPPPAGPRIASAAPAALGRPSASPVESRAMLPLPTAPAAATCPSR